MTGRYLLGQYLPRNSVLHTLDARSKLLGTLMLTAGMLWFSSWQQYLLITFAIGGLLVLGEIKIIYLVRGLRVLTWFVLMSFIMHAFTTGGQVVYQYIGLKLTIEGIVQGVMVGWRLLLLASIAIVLTATTSSLALTTALEVLLRPLQKLKIPVRQIAFMMGLSLRFIPLIAEETQRLKKALQSRGGYVDDGPWTLRMKTLYAMIVPLIVLTFKRSHQLAQAMEARCYGGDNYTDLQVPGLSARDYLGLLLCIGVLIACYLIG